MPLAWKIFVWIGAMLVLLMLLRVGITLRLDTPQTVYLRLGLLHKTLSLEAKEKKPTPSEKEKHGSGKKSAKNRAKKDRVQLSAEDGKRAVKMLAPALKTALSRTRRSVRLHPLNVHLIIASSDPAETAQRYGWAEAAMWSLMPQAERLLQIPDPHVRLDADFEAQHSRVEGEVGCSIRIGSIFRIALTMVPPLLRWLRTLSTRQGKRTMTAAASDQPQGETNEER